MKAADLLAEVKTYWPETIDISDGHPTGGTGFSFPTLSLAWDKAEESANETYQLIQLGVWAFFQAAHRFSRSAFAEACSEISADDVELAVFDHYMRDNLAGESWENERAVYNESNASEGT